MRPFSFPPIVLALLAVVVLADQPAWAQTSAEDRIARLERMLADQADRLAAQERRLEEQGQEIARLKGAAPADPILIGPELQPDLAATRGRGVAVAMAQAAAPAAQAPESVGEAPVQAAPAAEIAALPEFASVLTPPGGSVFEPSFEFSVASGNRLVFRGVEIIPGLQIGLIEASETQRETAVATFAYRRGLTDRLEFEARAPYLWREDVISTVQQRDSTVTQTVELGGSGFGDAEASLRYQVTDAKPEKPIVIANLRVKSDTGEGPFDIPRDEFGIASRLATGSGFWGVEPGVTMLYATDPAVIFMNAGYMFNLERDIDRVIGEGDNAVRIGAVDPGDSLSASVGFGMALNPRFSFSMGYRHNWLMETKSEFNDTIQRSDDAHVGSLLLSGSLKTAARHAVSLNMEFGVTEEAPGARIVFRLPLSSPPK